MNPERWQQIVELFHAAFERAPESRQRFLEDACRDDADLRLEVESLLAHREQAGSFLETPALPNSPATSSAGLAAGRQFGSYRILGPLGAGGMGEVYRAHDGKLGRDVAIKTLPPEFAGDPDRLARFRREARALAALNHPNIATIYGLEESDKVDYLVLELVEGQTLAERIQQTGPLPVEKALDYARQIAEALEAAHSKGIIHRDLKPANVKITPEGRVKVLDFGLAKAVWGGDDASKPSGLATDTMSATLVGHILGTPAYMSPEQAEGKPVDARSDIFSFGAVVYEMLAGQRAFRGESPTATLAQVLNQEPTPPLHDILPSIPPELDRLITRCMRKDPERRLRSMADLKVILQELKEESQSAQGARAAAVRPKVARNWLWMWPAAAVFCVAAIGLFWLFRPSSGTRESALKEMPLTSYRGSEEDPSFSPDGNQVAFSWNGEKEDNFDIYVKLIGPGAPLRLTTNPLDDTDPAWSPDGRTIAFLRDLGANKFGVFLIPALGGPERKLREIFIPASQWLTGPYLAWLPDSKGIIFTDQDSKEHPSGLFLLRLDSNERQRLTLAPAGALGDSAPAVSPDGSSLVFARTTGVGPGDLYLLPLKENFGPAGEPKRITFFNWAPHGAAWTSNGREIVFANDSRLWEIAVPRFGGRPGEPRRLESIGVNAFRPAISRQGRRLAYSAGSGGDLDIWRVAIPDWRKTSAPFPPAKLISSTWDEFAPQYSPDGRRIAFESSRSGHLEIWVCENDGSNCVQLTSFGGPATGLPHWSPDGQRIAFYSRVKDKAQIHVINAEGGAPQQLSDGTSDDMFSNWSQDGRWIYFSSNRSGVDQIWRIPSNGGAAVQTTRNGGFAVCQSPDSKYLYYTRSKEQNTSLWRMPAEGGPESQVAKSLVLINYAVTVRGIYFMTQPDLHSGKKLIQFLSVAGEPAKLIASTERDVYAGFAVSPDERWLLFAQREPGSSDLVLVENFE